MKPRSQPLRRSRTAIARGKPPRRKKPPKKIGRSKRRRMKVYNAYLRSAHWKAFRAQVLQRDGHRCRAWIVAAIGFFVPQKVDADTPRRWSDVRCAETERLTVHHLTYARLGKERLGDCITLCKGHHDAEERRLRPWNAYRRSA